MLRKRRLALADNTITPTVKQPQQCKRLLAVKKQGKIRSLTNYDWVCHQLLFEC